MAHPSVNICYFAFRSRPSVYDIDRIASISEHFIVFDSSITISEFHIMSAFKEAKRVFSKNSKYRRLGTLFLMYLTGNDQIESAIRSARITQNTEKFISILLGEQKCEDILKLLPENVCLIERPIPVDIPEKDRKIFDAMTMVSLKL